MTHYFNGKLELFQHSVLTPFKNFKNLMASLLRFTPKKSVILVGLMGAGKVVLRIAC